ncbi:MAG: ribonuclease PH [Chloroflexi bacterium]|nr:ribonuclease PH [Chloroflexota bacterium]
MARIDGRANDELRPVRIIPGALLYPEGSALIYLGNTKIVCAVTAEETVPPFLRGKGQGWLTAEYAMLPRATSVRTTREVALGRVGGRTQEIQRLIGRSLRSAVDLTAIGERTLLVDCDVLQADGGTRTAAITGSYVAVVLALRKLVERGVLKAMPPLTPVAATSVGVVEGDLVLDLAYEEDSRAQVDFNIVMTHKADFVEVQGTAEHRPFSRTTANLLLDLAEKGIRELLALQNAALGY